MKKLLLFVCVSLGVTCVFAEPISLHTLITEAGYTASDWVSGGTADKHYPSTLPPKNAFDGNGTSTDTNKRWLGEMEDDIEKSTYLAVRIPDEMSALKISSYKIWRIPNGSGHARERAPTEWNFYGVTEDGETNELHIVTSVDGISWTDTLTTMTFETLKNATTAYREFVWYPRKSKSDYTWDVGVMEFEIFVEDPAIDPYAANAVVVNSKGPEGLTDIGTATPNFNTHEDVAAGTTFSIEKYAYLEGVQYCVTGYVAEVWNATTEAYDVYDSGSFASSDETRSWTYQGKDSGVQLTWLFDVSAYGISFLQDATNRIETITTAAFVVDGIHYYSPQTTVLATAQETDFLSWVGDVESSDYLIQLTMDGPKQLGICMTKWICSYSGSNKIITDGVWRLVGSGNIATLTIMSHSKELTKPWKLDLETKDIFDTDGKKVTIKEIGDRAFQSADITELLLPSTIKTIGEDAYNGLTHLTKLVLDLPNLASLKARAFAACPKLETATLKSEPAEKFDIFSHAFINSPALKEVVYNFPSAKTNAFTGVFNGCAALERVVFASISNRIEYFSKTWANTTALPNLTNFVFLGDCMTDVGVLSNMIYSVRSKSNSLMADYKFNIYAPRNSQFGWRQHVSYLTAEERAIRPADAYGTLSLEHDAGVFYKVWVIDIDSPYPKKKMGLSVIIR